MTKRAFILTEDESGHVTAKYHVFDDAGNLIATEEIEPRVLPGRLVDLFFGPSTAYMQERKTESREAAIERLAAERARHYNDSTIQLIVEKAEQPSRRFDANTSKFVEPVKRKKKK